MDIRYLLHSLKIICYFLGKSVFIRTYIDDNLKVYSAATGDTTATLHLASTLSDRTVGLKTAAAVVAVFIHNTVSIVFQAVLSTTSIPHMR